MSKEPVQSFSYSSWTGAAWTDEWIAKSQLTADLQRADPNPKRQKYAEAVADADRPAGSRKSGRLAGEEPSIAELQRSHSKGGDEQPGRRIQKASAVGGGAARQHVQKEAIRTGTGFAVLTQT